MTNKKWLEQFSRPEATEDESYLEKVERQMDEELSEEQNENLLRVAALSEIDKANAKTVEPLQDCFIFYGFSGVLANCYSKVHCEPSVIQAFVEYINFVKFGEYNFSCLDEKQLYEILVSMGYQMGEDIGNYLTQVSIEEVGTKLRIGDFKIEEKEFVEADEDEMDENCVIGCTPGDHKCGR